MRVVISSTHDLQFRFYEDYLHSDFLSVSKKEWADRPCRYRDSMGLCLCRGGCMTEMRHVPLPADLCAAAETKFSHVFGTLEELLIFVLRDLSRDEAARADQAEQRLVEERLRELGYL